MSKNVVLTLESRFMDEYGEYANLPVFNAHGSIVGYVGGEVPESGNPCEFNRLNDEGFTFCASATEVVRLKAENAKLREIIAYLEELLPESERRYIHETVKAISEDNAKLRKLLLDVWNDAMQFDGFWEYVHDDGEIYREDELPHYQERMRELGIEVD